MSSMHLAGSDTSGLSRLLKPADRRRLRQIVKRVHFAHYPKDFLTDYEADKLIDSFSEKVIEKNLRIGSKLGVD